MHLDFFKENADTVALGLGYVHVGASALIFLGLNFLAFPLSLITLGYAFVVHCPCHAHFSPEEKEINTIYFYQNIAIAGGLLMVTAYNGAVAEKKKAK